MKNNKNLQQQKLSTKNPHPFFLQLKDERKKKPKCWNFSFSICTANNVKGLRNVTFWMKNFSSTRKFSTLFLHDAEYSIGYFYTHTHILYIHSHLTM